VNPSYIPSDDSDDESIKLNKNNKPNADQSFVSSDDEFQINNKKKKVEESFVSDDDSEDEEISKVKKLSKKAEVSKKKNNFIPSDDSDDDDDDDFKNSVIPKTNVTKGYVPSDDSEESYKEPKKTNKYAVSDDSEDESPAPKKKRNNPIKKKKSFQTDSESDDNPPIKNTAKQKNVYKDSDDSDSDTPIKRPEPSKKKNNFNVSSSESDFQEKKPNVQNFESSSNSENEQPTAPGNFQAELAKKTKIFERNKKLRLAKKARYEQNKNNINNEALMKKHKELNNFFNQINNQKNIDREEITRMEEEANQNFERRRNEIMENTNPNSVEVNQQLLNVQSEIFNEVTTRKAELRETEKNNVDILNDHEIDLRKLLNRKREAMEELFVSPQNNQDKYVLIEKIEIPSEQKSFVIRRDYGEVIHRIVNEGMEIVDGGVNLDKLMATPKDPYFKKMRKLEVWGIDYDSTPQPDVDTFFTQIVQIEALINEVTENIRKYMLFNFIQ
jgi:hypothetical protein